MDFGVQLYDRAVERELTVTNSGKVPFAFNFNYSRLSRPGIVEATPASGTIAPLAKEVIKLKVGRLQRGAGRGGGVPASGTDAGVPV